MENTKIKKDLNAFIDGLTVKKQKNTGKKFFFDKDEFLILDIVVKSKLVFTHKSSFPMLKDIPDREAENMVRETLHDLGFEAEGIAFLDNDYPSEKSIFEPDSLLDSGKSTIFQAYQAYKNRANLVTIKN
jgi:hypothetical protein